MFAPAPRREPVERVPARKFAAGLVIGLPARYVLRVGLAIVGLAVLQLASQIASQLWNPATPRS